MQVRVASVLRMYSDCYVTKHRFQSSGCHDDALVAVLDGIRERREDAELDASLEVGDLQLGATFDVHVIHFKVADG